MAQSRLKGGKWECREPLEDGAPCAKYLGTWDDGRLTIIGHGETIIFDFETRLVQRSCGRCHAVHTLGAMRSIGPMRIEAVTAPEFEGATEKPAPPIAE